MTSTKDPHPLLVSKLARKLGDAAAAELDQLAQINLLVHASSGGAEAADAYRASIERVAECLGTHLAEQYDASLRRKLEQHSAAQTARFGRARALLERAESGEPLVSTKDIVELLESPAGAELAEALGRGLEQTREGQPATPGAPEPPEDDLVRAVEERRPRPKSR